MTTNEIVLTGNVATEVRQFCTKQGQTIAKFRFASTPRHFDREQARWVDGKTLFVNVVCWRALGDNVASSVQKGDPLLVRGRVGTDVWERDGVVVPDVEVTANFVGHDLSRGTATFRRVQRNGGEPSTKSDASQAAHGEAGPSTAPTASIPTQASATGRDWGGLEPMTYSVQLDPTGSMSEPADSSVTADGAPPRRQDGGGHDPWATAPSVGEEIGERAA